MTTRTDIANRALSAMAARSTITNIGENSAEASAVRMLYDSTRDELLRAAHWNFARATANLSLLKAAPGTPENPTSALTYDPATMPPPPWQYEYSVPNDSLQIRFVSSTVVQGGFSQPLFSVNLPSSQTWLGMIPSRFALATDRDSGGSQVNVILTDRPQALAVYTRRIDVEDLWDATFQEAMVASLAARLVMPLSGKMEMRKLCAQMAMQQVQSARSRDGNEGSRSQDHTPDWIAIRGNSGAILGSDGFGFYGEWVTPSFLVF